MTNGYDFYIDGMLLPITPPSLKISVGSTNKVVTLINEGEINILKSPALVEVSFTARFPMRNYPYTKVRNVDSFQSYYSKLRSLKEGKRPFQFIVARTTPKGTVTWDTNLQMALETFTVNENADNGDDVLVDFKLRQWKSYGSKTVKITNDGKTTKATPNRQSKETTKESSAAGSYTVKDGDTLWAIAKKYYGDGSQYTKILEANSSTIESTAKNHGMQSSQGGHWIWSGTNLIIP